MAKVFIEQSARTPHELRKAVHEALRRSAPANDGGPEEFVPELIALYEELRADRQIEEFDRKRLLGLVRTRLESIAKKLEKRAAQPRSVQTRGDVLAQQAPPPGGGRPPGRARGGAIGAAPNGLPDNGPALVDLIKRTIAPTTWDDVGGSGTIVYYRPLRVLVVRQTGEVHERIGGALGGLRGK